MEGRGHGGVFTKLLNIHTNKTIYCAVKKTKPLCFSIETYRAYLCQLEDDSKEIIGLNFKFS